MTGRAPTVLYTQTGCAESASARAWLTERGVPFAERNVTGDEAAARDLAATGTFATPLLVANGATVFGFRPDRMIAILTPPDGA